MRNKKGKKSNKICTNTYLPLQINILLQKIRCDNYYNKKFKSILNQGS